MNYNYVINNGNNNIKPYDRYEIYKTILNIKNKISDRINNKSNNSNSNSNYNKSSDSETKTKINKKVKIKEKIKRKKTKIMFNNLGIIKCLETDKYKSKNIINYDSNKCIYLMNNYGMIYMKDIDCKKYLFNGTINVINLENNADRKSVV